MYLLALLLNAGGSNVEVPKCSTGRSRMTHVDLCALAAVRLAVHLLTPDGGCFPACRNQVPNRAGLAQSELGDVAEYVVALWHRAVLDPRDQIIEHGHPLGIDEPAVRRLPDRALHQ